MKTKPKPAEKKPRIRPPEKRRRGDTKARAASQADTDGRRETLCRSVYDVFVKVNRFVRDHPERGAEMAARVEKVCPEAFKH
jgi:hypothetical protein